MCGMNVYACVGFTWMTSMILYLSTMVFLKEFWQFVLCHNSQQAVCLRFLEVCPDEQKNVLWDQWKFLVEVQEKKKIR